LATPSDNSSSTSRYSRPLPQETKNFKVIPKIFEFVIPAKAGIHFDLRELLELRDQDQKQKQNQNGSQLSLG
jgi:hypothetical protein